MRRLFSLRTTRVASVVKAFVGAHPGAAVRVDLKPEVRPVEVWCTNRLLKSARDFSLAHNEVELLGFHDGYKNMWAHESTQALLDNLVSQRLTRYTVTPESEGRSLREQAASKAGNVIAIVLVFAIVLVLVLAWGVGRGG